MPPLSGDAGLLHDDNAWRRLRAGREWMTILDALEESVILEREDGSVARCNKAAAQTFRFDLHTVEGRRLTELLGEEVPFSALREPGAVV
ncbi:MAG: PAS domain-containing protein, partial [Deltaproteobacteria bacterium]|nr:PAS domain-containing protein [Deltaproteobacteria bacterium]